MQNARIVILVIAALLVARPCSAQVLDTTEYRGFLKTLDASADSWQGKITSLNVDQLNIVFSTGKAIESQKEMALKNLVLIHALISKQNAQDKLSNDVSLMESMVDVTSMLDGITIILPNTDQALQWQRTINQLTEEIGGYRLSLEKHILAYADQLQEKAERCSK